MHGMVEGEERGREGERERDVRARRESAISGIKSARTAFVHT